METLIKLIYKIIAFNHFNAYIHLYICILLPHFGESQPEIDFMVMVMIIVFNTTFNNILDI